MMKGQELDESEVALVNREMKTIVENGGMITPDPRGQIPLDRFI